MSLCKACKKNGVPLSLIFTIHDVTALRAIRHLKKNDLFRHRFLDKGIDLADNSPYRYPQ